ncbi:MAG TPA: helix-turn-helix domain-containing protein [Thermoleophilaceae bacterium]|nr:helix-turn-helix domain-containing protein [Thermoleophilaceae bacterium]
MQSGPWQALPPSVADVIEPELDAITEEIMATIAREVPDYARPFEGSFGRGVRTGVTEALRQFLALIRSPSGGRGPGREVYVALGRGELRQGRTLDSLQSAYRVGARVAWRRVAEAARRADLDPETISLLAESIFAYIEEISADSVEGYAEARSRVEDERRRRRRELVALLLREPPAEEADVRAAAAGAGWQLPRTAAALALPAEELARLAPRLPADALAAEVEGVGCAILPDPEGPGRAGEIGRALESSRPANARDARAPERDRSANARVARAREGGRPADTRVGRGPDGDRSADRGPLRRSARARAEGLGALGPAGPLRALPVSWTLARATLRAVEAGAIDSEGSPVRADDVLADLLIFENRALVERIAARRLAPLRELTPKARDRMEETALAYLRERGNAAAMARALDVHPQTARYRLARLRELLGPELDDPDARFELELALRGRPPRT